MSEFEAGLQQVFGGPEAATAVSAQPADVVREIRASEIPVSVRHQTIFGAIDALEPDQAIRLRVDHEPKPLFYMLQAERAGKFAWLPEQDGPDEWVVVVRRLAGHSCC